MIKNMNYKIIIEFNINNNSLKNNIFANNITFNNIQNKYKYIVQYN